MKRIISALLKLVLTLFIFISFTNGKQILLSLGIIKESIYIAGTGSMYPTFPKGEGDTDIKRAQETVAWPEMRRYPGGVNFLGVNLFKYDIKRGDIVDFENEKTKEITTKQYQKPAGFVKRIIALPHDTIEIRDGFVYLNESILKEPYIASPRSSFGGDFLADCQKLVIPEGKLFVMGDNRKGSLDSRFSLGLINEGDIHHVLPKNLQTPYEKNWRQTDQDESNAHQPTLDVAEFLKLLNQKRDEIHISPLKYDNLLVTSSYKRADDMLKMNDFSIEATRSGYTLEKSINESGYNNIIYAEALARGYYEAPELLENLMQFPETKKLVLDKEYQDIGLSPVVGDINNCPVQVVVIHLGGYQDPNYKKEDIESWQKLSDNLAEAIISWEKFKDIPEVNQEILNKLLDSLYKRKSNTQKILYKLNHNLWLSSEEKLMTEDDQKLATVEEELSNQLRR